MSETTPTPGPWAVERGTEIVGLGEEFEVVADGGAVLLAQPPTEADARLIAAAPDLLAALEYIVAWAPVDWSPAQARAMALAAIAKAKGL